MTYQEYREAVIADIIEQMAPESRWTREDAEYCTGDLFAEYKTGKTPRQTASAILWVEAQPEIN